VLIVVLCSWSGRPAGPTTNTARLSPRYEENFYFISNKSPTGSNNIPVYYPDFIYSSTCFGGFPTHHQELNDYSGGLWFYLRIVVIVVLKPEAATTVIELLMMGGKTPETC
jgi:hypothetical protein